MIPRIVERYTTSLFELAQESDRLETVQKDLINIQKTINQSDELKLFITNPVLIAQKRVQSIDDMFRGHVDPLTLSFIQFLESKKRLELLNLIIKSFEQKYLEFNNTVEALITSANKLNKDQLNEVTTHLSNKLNAKIIPVCKVKPSLIGGIKIQIKDNIYDYSIETQLNSFQHDCIHSL